MEKEKNINTGQILLIVILLLLVLGLGGFIVYDKVLAQKHKTPNNITETTKNKRESSINNKQETKNETTTDNNATANQETKTVNYSSATTNMSYEEVFSLWEKIKGNWAKVEYVHDLCAGSALEINTYMLFKKFNSDGIVRRDIVSFEKVNDNQYKVNLITPVDLNNQMSGDIVAHYLTITVDISKLNEKILRIYTGENYTDYNYVGKNELIYNETTKYQPVNGGFTQDYYCEWYDKNH